MMNRRNFVIFALVFLAKFSTVELASDAVECPPLKCPSGCETVIRDVNGCATCQCRTRQCSGVTCRMYCFNGFKRDEFGCEICACNDAPRPCPIHDCPQSLVCANGLKVDENGCTTCTCKDDDTACPTATCRMFCMYGFRRNEKGCELCECDWSPIAENLQCSERIPCPGTRVCNLNLKLCEIVDRDRVNWFVYDFELKTTLLTDEKFLSTFKSGLIHNIGKKYNLKSSQIAVSSVEPAGLTSFQVMPYYDEDLEEFQTKIDQIDSDLNSHAFRAVLPAIVDAIGEDSTGSSTSVLERVRCRWNRFPALRRRLFVCTIAFLFTVSGVVLLVLLVKLVVKKRKYAKLDECQSKISAENEDDKEALVTEKGEPPIRAV